MKFVKFNCIVIFLCALAPSMIWSQTSETQNIGIQLSPLKPYASFSEQSLMEAEGIDELNEHFKLEWIDQYLKVEISTIQNGKLRTTQLSDHFLTEQVKAELMAADVGQAAHCLIEYMPKNSLSHNTPTSYDFDMFIEPLRNAQMKGGKKMLESYIKTHVIDKLPENALTGYQFSGIRFTVDTEGKISDIEPYHPDYKTDDTSEVDALLLEAICNMPVWQAARNHDNTLANQSFTLVVGNLANCLVQTLEFE